VTGGVAPTVARVPLRGSLMTTVRMFTVLLLFATTPLCAQLDPTLRWKTLRTPHFNVHFSPGLDTLARRSAVYAESAYVRLSRELHPPRGPIDLAIGDNVDFTNGFATIFPSNRIVIYAQPPVATRELRFYEDWAQLIIAHELLHIFHIDRSRGVWRLLQRVVGRNPAFFPNAYLPSWVKEGLAVVYETRLTTSGRLASTDFPMTARTAHLDGRVPTSRDWSLATTQYPLGNTAYAYGALLMEWLAARSTDSTAMRRFVDHSAGWLIPFMVNPAARAAFGVSVPKAFSEWEAQLARGEVRAPLGWRAHTPANWMAEYPRWRDDSTVIVAMQPAQQMPGVYAVTIRAGDTTNAAPRRIGRRNSLDANVPLADSSLLYAEFDQVDPFTLRSDLWVEVHGEARRLTRGARLSHPDVPPGDRIESARIVAVQSVQGTTRLVRVSASGDSIWPITEVQPDTQWSEPRWRADGRAIAAVRLSRGGRSAVVLLDSAGRLVGEVGQTRGVIASPHWINDTTVLYSSDQTGVSQLYRATLPFCGCTTVRVCRLSSADPQITAITASATGVFHPSMDRRGRVVALHFRRNGMEVIAAPITAPSGTPIARAHYVQDVASPRAPATDSARPTAYSPWRMLLPTYWTPIIGQSALGSATFGGATSGVDLIGRHAWSALVAVPTARPDVEGAFTYRYRGFGQPLVDVSGSQSWDYFDLGVLQRRPSGPRDTVVVPTILRRVSRIGSVALTVIRPGLRQSGALSVGASLEQRDFSTDPAEFLGTIDPVFRTKPIYPAFTASGSWTSVQRAGRAVSLEDGITISASAQRRWREGSAQPTASTRLVGAVRGYKSIPWVGFSRHAVALRVAGAWNDRRASSDVSVGGVSGTQVEVLPGVVAGDPARTFAVRGYTPGVQRGISAAAGSIEYRAPLLAIARGMGSLPVFLDRTSLSLFGDIGRAWCPAGDRTTICAGTAPARTWLSSAGVELSLLGAIAYDAPLRARVGVAQPFARPMQTASRRPVGYVTLGASF
jgi:hypothetical protein